MYWIKKPLESPGGPTPKSLKLTEHLFKLFSTIYHPRMILHHYSLPRVALNTSLVDV